MFTNPANIVCNCPICRGITIVEVEEADYQRYANGALVQDAFPYLLANEREAIISGICTDCWEKMFGSSDNADDCNHDCWNCPTPCI